MKARQELRLPSRNIREDYLNNDKKENNRNFNVLPKLQVDWFGNSM